MFENIRKNLNLRIRGQNKNPIYCFYYYSVLLLKICTQKEKNVILEETKSCSCEFQ